MSVRVAAAMSGGVDSTVAAAIVKAAGHEVFGVTMRLFGEEEDDPAIAMAAAACKMLGIEHTVLDMRANFRKVVIGNFIDEYGAGRTPNPCVRCNERIKFGQMMKLAEFMGAQRLTTGHYARILVEGGSDRLVLMAALDHTKDQSYFLYRLTQKQLSQIGFPVGELTKDEVRDRARAMGLPNADREDSQEVCFVPDDDYRAFLKKEWPALVEPGDFVDAGGNFLGTHEGIAFYTIGQRRGLGIPSADGRLYVVKRDPLTRQIILGERETLLKTDMMLEDTTFVSETPPNGPFEAEVKIRYRTPPTRAKVYPEGTRAKVVFAEPVESVSPGQSAVFYHGDRVLGGGVITA